MSSPGSSQALVRPDLRDAVVSEWDVTGEAANFIADSVAKQIDVPTAAGTMTRIPREMMTKDPNTLNRGADGGYSRGEWTDETFTFFTKEQGFEMPIDQNMANQAKLYYDAEMVASRIAMSKAKRGHEILVAAAIMNTSTFTGASLTTAVSTNWRTSGSTAVPIADIKGARQKVRENCGRDANTLILDWVGWEALIETAQIVGRINGGATNEIPARAKMQAVATLIGLDNIIVARGLKDSGKQGQVYAGAGIWTTTTAMIAYINPMASLFDINLCNAYNWDGDGGSWDWTLERYYNEEKRRDVVRTRRQVGVKVEYPECGHLLTAAA